MPDPTWAERQIDAAAERDASARESARRTFIAAPFKITAVFGVVILSILIQGPAGPLYALAGYGFMEGARRVWLFGESVADAWRLLWRHQADRYDRAHAPTTQGEDRDN